MDLGRVGIWSGHLRALAIDDAAALAIELEDLATVLAHLVQHWRATHPGRPWADELAQSSA